MARNDVQLPVHFALVVYPQFEVLDAFGPTEVLHCLGNPLVYHDFGKITLSIIGPDSSPVSSGPSIDDPTPIKSRVAQTIVPTHTFDNPPENIDVLIVPGGFGAGPKALFGGDWEPAGVERVVRFLRETYPFLKHLLSECDCSSLWTSVASNGSLLTNVSSRLQRCRSRCSGRNTRQQTSHHEQTAVACNHCSGTEDALVSTC